MHDLLFCFLIIAPRGIEITQSTVGLYLATLIIAPRGIEIYSFCSAKYHACLIIAPRGIEIKVQIHNTTRLDSYNRTKRN